MKIDRWESEGRNNAEILLQMLSPPDGVILGTAALILDLGPRMLDVCDKNISIAVY